MSVESYPGGDYGNIRIVAGNQASYEKKLKMLDIHVNIQPEYAIVMMDINHLKKMNDEYGHEHGSDYDERDQLIKELRRQFKETALIIQNIQNIIYL